ncbi:MAG: YceI family protein [Planctomycetales bacterium]|nr:YceI family protein [Planctomycetales bacterium]
MTRKSVCVAIGLLAFSTLPATVGNAQQQSVGQTAQRSYVAGDVYLASSRVYALVGKTGFGHEHGVAGALKSGRILLGASKDAGELVFDMTSFTADTDAARAKVGLEGKSSESTQQQVTANMLGKDVLNVAKYPTAVFKIDSAVALPARAANESPRYQLSGSFTLQKATRPLSVVAEVRDANGWKLVQGAFRLKQTDYGITPFTKAFGAIGVADEMTVWGEFWVTPGGGVVRQAARTAR